MVWLYHWPTVETLNQKLSTLVESSSDKLDSFKDRLWVIDTKDLLNLQLL